MVAESKTAQNPRIVNLAAVVEAMKRPEFYPHRPRRVEFRQTHISCVFLAGDVVYKIKKPVRFPFLDCSTLDRRRHFCLEEVRLNRRLAPDVYLAVHSIKTDRGRLVLGPEVSERDPSAVEYAVKMRRLPDDRMLGRLAAANRLKSGTVRAIAEKIAKFHERAAKDRGWIYGSAAAVARIAIGNLAETEQFIGNTLTPEQSAALERFDQRFTASHWEALNERVRAGRVCEGHGDLRCEHVFVPARGEIAIIDCVEFDERLRYADVASDLAFLAMDLERIGAGDAAEELARAYAEVSHDDALYQFLPFYKCHRAVVRAKVESLRAMEREVDASERARAIESARSYFALACRYANAAVPALIVVGGRSGTGKSTLAGKLRDRTGFSILSSDRTRKRLAGIAPEVHQYSAYDEGIYSEDFARKVYAKLLEEAERALREGRGVILDATYKHRDDRAAVSALAARIGVPFLFIECRADAPEVLRRLADRAKRQGEVSDATAEIYRRQNADYTPPTEIAEPNLMVADTTREWRELVDEIERALASLHYPPTTELGGPRK